ncbi:leucyl/phenylalanyl-tRNA--protein transferase [Gemmobacter caeruleus]|uniref:leucyl/phenylalanyl-tRNA--protein transferase n=1 Tax=Gemmobacter caeruleus TaxID=2595004 RepID=UPI0023AFA375|nr:leucyl/phenylalanyl-tRNA--protein transferase [Gemmobacter caeruleus]
MSFEITPELLLRAYAMGVFPMADSAEAAELHWVEPRMRGILPLDGFHLSRSLAKEMRRGGFEIVANRDFAGVLAGCADRPETWINGQIRDLYLALHARGHAHSLELWEDGALRGGTYGVTLGRAFFGESMFSRRRSASKIVLAHLVARLKARGFVLLDTQFLTPHLATLGGIEIPRAAYQARLAKALQGPPARFD